MMISPNFYEEQLRDASYLDLIEERDYMIRYMRKFEKDEKAGNRSSQEWKIHPSPEVRYQMYFDYLAVLCKVMHEKYNEEYVFGSKTLKQDVEMKEKKDSGV